MAETGADPDRRESFDFYQLLRAVESRIMATENAERMAVLLEEDALNVQLIQELQQQRNEISRQREGRLLNLGVQERAWIPPVSMDQEMDKMDLRKFTTLTNQSLAQGYSSVLGYEDWQNSI